jgi:hypothetical protein
LTLFDFFRPRSPPRFRAATRDLATDAARFDRVRASIDEEIAGIDAEAAGVQRRLDEARFQAVGLFGNDSACEGGRDAQEEKLLAEAERQLLGASRRLDHLREQRRRFEALQQHVAATLGAQQPVIAASIRAGARKPA